MENEAASKGLGGSEDINAFWKYQQEISMYGDGFEKGPKLPLLVILCILCGLTALSKGQTGLATGPLRALPSNPRYFTDGSGRAIYLSGPHNWYSLQDNGHRLYNGEDPAPAFDYNA